MNVGVFHVPHPDVDPGAVASRAEQLGFDSYWLGDHTIWPVETATPYPGGPPEEGPPDYLWQLPDPFIGLARASATTSTIKLGTGVCLVGEREPILLAAQAATLDRMSGGRFLFGVGGGWNPEESAILGGDFERRWSQVKDRVAAIKVLWTDDPSEYHGEYADFPAVRCYPKPLQQPHPPVLLGSLGTPLAARRVAEWGDGWFPIVQSVAEFVAGRQEVERHAHALGRDPGSIDFSIFSLFGQWATRADCEAFAQAGCDRLVIWLDWLEHDGLMEQLESLAQELLPTGSVA